MSSFLWVLETLLYPSLLKRSWCWRHILTCLPDVLFFSPSSGCFLPLSSSPPPQFPCLVLTSLSSSSTCFEFVSFLELSFVPQIQAVARCCRFSFQSKIWIIAWHIEESRCCFCSFTSFLADLGKYYQSSMNWDSVTQKNLFFLDQSGLILSLL